MRQRSRHAITSVSVSVCQNPISYTRTESRYRLQRWVEELMRLVCKWPSPVTPIQLFESGWDYMIESLSERMRERWRGENHVFPGHCFWQQKTDRMFPPRFFSSSSTPSSKANKVATRMIHAYQNRESQAGKIGFLCCRGRPKRVRRV